jgi:amino acid transporter
MTNKKDPSLERVEHFEKKTYREVTLWDWCGRVLPMVALAVIVVCHFFKWSTALELTLEVISIAFFIICFVWWYWAIFKIAATVKYLRETQERFISLTTELKKFKEAFKKTKPFGDNN